MNVRIYLFSAPHYPKELSFLKVPKLHPLLYLIRVLFKELGAKH